MRSNQIALAVLLTSFSMAATAHADEPDPCIGAWAAARPGPITPLQKAIRLIPNSVVLSAADFSVRLVDASGQERPVVVEQVESGSYFLRAAQELSVGSYQLEYTDACKPTAQIIDLTVLPTLPFPASLGTVTINYEAYCPGETVDSPWGPISKDFPPPISVYFELAPELQGFGPFMRLQIHDDLGTPYTSNGFLFFKDQTNISCRRSAACSGNSLSVPIGERTVIVTAEIVDGPQIPPATTDVNITCLDCPPKPPVEPPPPPIDENNSNDPPKPQVHGCSVGQFGARDEFASIFLLLMLASCWRRRSGFSI